MINIKIQARKNSDGGHKGSKSSAAVVIPYLWMLSEKTRMSVSVYAALASHTGLMKTWGSRFSTCGL